MKNRIDHLFEQCRAQDRAALILYLTAGFPDAEATRRLLPILEESGCDLIEAGVPFSDPIADGPIIQAASTVALRNGMTFQKALDIVSDFRQSSQLPLIFFGAYNPFFHRGLEETARDAAAAGADGFLAADLPLEESEPFRRVCQKNNLHLISLIAPTSPDHRIQAYAKASSGFIYCIALKGITGTRSAEDGEITPYLERVRRLTALPIAIGFGVKTPEQAAAFAPHCDAVVVGSALVSLIDKCTKEGLSMEKEVGAYVRSLAEALKRKRAVA